jgi:hypothetical protein
VAHRKLKAASSSHPMLEDLAHKSYLFDEAASKVCHSHLSYTGSLAGAVRALGCRNSVKRTLVRVDHHCMRRARHRAASSSRGCCNEGQPRARVHGLYSNDGRGYDACLLRFNWDPEVTQNFATAAAPSHILVLCNDRSACATYSRLLCSRLRH